MGKEAVVYRAENALKDLSEYGFKRLYTTQGFRLMGIVTWDKKIPDESLGERRRWVKGLKIENGTPYRQMKEFLKLRSIEKIPCLESWRRLSFMKTTL